MGSTKLTNFSYRGSFVGLHSQFIGFGYAVANWIGFGVYFTTGPFTVGPKNPELKHSVTEFSL